MSKRRRVEPRVLCLLLMPDLLTIIEAAAQLKSGAVRAIDLTEASLSAIARQQPLTNAFIHVDAEGARAAARRADEERAQGRAASALHGIPISLKDLIDVAGEVTTAASRVLADRRARADAPVVTRLRAAGAILIGKTNLHEFALGTTSEESAFGAVKNPRDPSRSAGGSSGGSAAAVATRHGAGVDRLGHGRIHSHPCRRLRRRRPEADDW